MTDTVIKIENLSKRYRLGELHKQTNSFRERMTRAFCCIAHSGKLKKSNPITSSSDDAIWALRNLSFEVRRSEIIGIIGRNGAGKSTLLKILSRITKPTEGKAWINGRVGSLLEVGTGFHAELTGRENIFLNGAILGMTKIEIKQKFDEIVSFAGIEKFIDTPVKRYSSGMYVRLAFSVAANLEHEIMLIDEVLAVGDYNFQKKCLNNMKNLTQQGRTIIFVSHNMNAIQSLCNHVFLIDGGTIISNGTPENVINDYLSNTVADKFSFIISDRTHRVAGVEKVFKNILLLNNEGRATNSFPIGSDITILIEIHLKRPIKNAILGIGLKSEQGIMSALFGTFHSRLTFDLNEGSYVIKGKLCKVMLTPGLYTLVIDLSHDIRFTIDRLKDIGQIIILPNDLWESGWLPQYMQRAWIGESKWNIEDRCSL